MPLLYGHYCIATREGNYSGLLLLVSGVKDGDGASFMSVRVFAAEALVTHMSAGTVRTANLFSLVTISNEMDPMYTTQICARHASIEQC